MVKDRVRFWLLVVGFAVHMLSIPLLGLDPLEGDAKQFNNEANNILDGIGWVNTEGSGQATTTYPAQVGFLLACKLLFGRDTLVIPVIIQHLFVLITALIAYRLALIAGLSRASALLAQAVVTFFPHMVYVSNVLISHTLGMFLCVLGIFLLMRGWPRAISYFGVGIVWGGATLARFSYQYFVLVWVSGTLVVELLRARKIQWNVLSRNLALLMGFLVVVSPWIIRVHKYEGGYSGYTDAWALCYALNRSPDQRRIGADDFLLALRADTTLSRSEKEAASRTKFFQNLREHPEWFIHNCLTNLSLLLVNVTTWGQPLRSVYAGMYYSMLLAFGIVGLISLRKQQHKRFLPAYVLAVVVFAVHIPIYGYVSNAFPVWASLSPIVATGAVLSFRAGWNKKKELR